MVRPMTEERGRQWNRLFDLIEQLALALAARGSWRAAEDALRVGSRAYRQWGAELSAAAGRPPARPRQLHLRFIDGEPKLRDLA